MKIPKGIWLKAMAWAWLIIASSAFAQPALPVSEPTWTLQFAGHSGSIGHRELSSDGRLVATSDTDGLVIVWDLASQKSLWSFKNPYFVQPTGYVRSDALRFSPDGQTLAVGGAGHQVSLYNLQDGALLRSWKVGREVYFIRFSPDGRWIASVGGNFTSPLFLELWGTGSQPVFSAQLAGYNLIAGGYDSVSLNYLLAFSDRLMVMVRRDGKVVAVDMLDFNERWSLEETPVGSAIALTLDGQTLAVGSHKGLQLLQAESGKVLIQLDPASSIGSLRFSPDGRMLASRPIQIRSNRDDGESRFIQEGGEVTTLWDTQTGQKLGVVDGSETLWFSPDRRQVLTHWAPRFIRWDVASGIEIESLPGPVGSVLTDAQGRRLILGGNGVAWYEIPSGTEHQIEGYNIQILAARGDGLLAIAGAGAGIRLFEGQSEVRRLSSKDCPGWFMSLAFSPDGKQLAVGSISNKVCIWDVAEGKLLMVLSGEEADRDRRNRQNSKGKILDPGLRGFARALAWSPDGKYLAVGYQARGIGIWDVQNAGITQRFLSHKNWVLSLDWSPDGKQLVSAAGDRTVRFWSLQEGKEIVSKQVHAAFVREVAYSPDGQYVASASGDGTVTLWEAKSGQPIHRFETEGLATSLTWTPDSGNLWVGTDQKILQWSVQERKFKQTLSGPKGLVLAVRLNKQGVWVVSRDNTLRVWEGK